MGALPPKPGGQSGRAGCTIRSMKPFDMLLSGTPMTIRTWSACEIRKPANAAGGVRKTSNP